MKRLCYFIFISILCLGLSTGCDNSQPTTIDKPLVVIGCMPYAILNNLHSTASIDTPSKQQKIINHYVEQTPSFKLDWRLYNKTTDLLMALKSKKIDYAHLPKSTADYIALSQPIHRIPDNGHEYYQMVFPSNLKTLREKFNGVISNMKKNGQLRELIKEMIDGSTQNPTPVTLPTFPDGDKIRVGITGALPPMDYMTTDGKAAGFNVALLSAIAQKLKLNIELVVVEVDTWPIAMKSSKIDVMFWILNYDKGIRDFQGLLFSQPFYEANEVFIFLDESPHPNFTREIKNLKQ